MPMKVLEPHEAVIAVGKQNTELVEEMAILHAEIDRYRNALTEIINMPPADIAADPNKPRIVATVALSNGTMKDPPEPQPKLIVLP